MRLYFPILFLLLVSCSCIAQSKIDSTKKLLQNSIQKKDVGEVAYYLSNIGMLFLNSNQFDSAIFYYKKSLESSVELDPSLKASALNGLGVSFNQKGYTDSSIYYYKPALYLYKQLKETNSTTAVEANLSIIYKNKGLYEDALEYAFSAISKLENRPPDRPLASCYNTVASVYLNLKDYNRALFFNRKALEVRTKMGYPKGVGQSRNNLGEVFLVLGQYDSALYHLLLAKEIKQKNGDPAAATLNNLGEVFAKTNRYKDAAEYFQQALTMHREMGDQIGQLKSLINLGDLSLLTADFRKAKIYLDESEKLSRQTGSLEYLKQSLEEKVKFYKAQRDFSNAFLYQQELLQVKDSLLNVGKAEALSSLQIKYETDKKEQHIKLLENEKSLQGIQLQSNRNWVRWLIGSAVLLLIIIALIFYLFRISQRNKERVELLLKELNHRVKNNLQILSSLLVLQSNYIKDDDHAFQAIKSNEGRVNAMALIHKKLSINDRNQQINMKEYLPELVQYLVQSYGYPQHRLNLVLDIQEIKLAVDKAIPLGLVINELVSNACKYAFKEQTNPQLVVRLNQENKSEIKIEIEDNGIGFEGSIDNPTSFGLKMVNMLAKELKAKIVFTTNQGTQFKMIVPI